MSKNLNRIQKLRQLIQGYNIDGYLIPSYDEFRNEYTPKHLRRLEWLTGFDGSNGVLLLTYNRLLFFTDNRYLLQAKKQLYLEFQIFDLVESDAWERALYEFRADLKLGYDPMIESIDSIKRYQKLFENKSIVLCPIEGNLVDKIWLDKPVLSKYNKILKLADLDAGLSVEDKLKQVLKKMDKNADYLLVTQLDSICWLLNIRGMDIDYSPLILGVLMINKHGDIYLFSDTVHEEIIGVKVLELNEIKSFFKQLLSQNKKIQTNSSASYWFEQIGVDNLIIREGIIEQIKACKNEVEIKNIRNAHFLDGLAICKFICWLEQHIDKTTEISAAEKLLWFRQQADSFVDLSFATISAFGANAAIVHYKSTIETNSTINKENLYLLDSGGQYKFGTTDVTRTFCFGNPSLEQKLHYTLVLKGLIRVSSARFPIGTNGAQLDSLARLDLWSHGLDYGHSTGHGVGYFLSVHEGPQRIARNSTVDFKAGMITSNEPGYYLHGKYGIRIENIMLVKDSITKGFLEFETLTLVPIPTNLIKFDLLDSNEKFWLRDYNNQVLTIMSQYLQDTEKKQLQRICYC